MSIFEHVDKQGPYISPDHRALGYKHPRRWIPLYSREEIERSHVELDSIALELAEYIAARDCDSACYLRNPQYGYCDAHAVLERYSRVVGW